MVVSSRLWVLPIVLLFAGDRSTSRETLVGPHRGSPAADGQPALRLYRDRDDLVLDLGPIDLPAHAMHDALRQPPPLAVRAPAEGWVHGFSVDIVDAAGAAVPQRVLHHLNVIVPEQRELFSQIMLRVAAAGSETAPVSLPPFIGYHIRAGDSLMVSTMLHNPTDRAYVGTHLRVRFKFSDASGFLHPFTIFPFYLDVMPPAGSHSFDLPPGRSERSWEGRPAIAGRILVLGGHLHKYGVSLKLEDRTANRVLWQVKPDTDSTGEGTSIPSKSFLRSFGLSIRPDHVYRLVAVYDNPTGAPIPDGGMGALGGVIWPSGSAPWPSVDRRNAEYQDDVRVTWRRVPSAHDHMRM